MSTIKVTDLQAGDILLYHGTKWISKAIRKFDGTNYNHAALYYEDKKVIEAIAKGVVENEIDDSFSDSSPITVYRLVNAPGDMKPVTDAATSYIGKPYAYLQLILLAVICLFRKIKMNSIVGKLVEAILQKAATLIMGMFGAEGKNSIICSELVYRSYNDAGDNYKIEIDRTREKTVLDGSEESFMEAGCLYERLFGQATKIQPFIEKTADMPFEELSDDECEALIDKIVDYSEEEPEENLDEETEERLRVAAGHLFDAINQTSNKQFGSSISIWDIIKALCADGSDFVTPGDLYKSQNLQSIGDIH